MTDSEINVFSIGPNICIHAVFLIWSFYFKRNKNSPGDEIANVKFYAVHPGSYPNSLK